MPDLFSAGRCVDGASAIPLHEAPANPASMTGLCRAGLSSSTPLAFGGAVSPGSTAAQDTLQPWNGPERKGHLCQDDDRPSRRVRRRKDRDDRCHRPQGPSHGVQHGRQKGGWTPDRSDEGKPEHEVACNMRPPGGPLNFLVTAGQVSVYIGARALASGLPKVACLL